MLSEEASHFNFGGQRERESKLECVCGESNSRDQLGMPSACVDGNRNWEIIQLVKNCPATLKLGFFFFSSLGEATVSF